MTATTHEGTAIYSTFGGDPELGELVELFVHELPDRISTLEEAFASKDENTLRGTAHQLKGAGGSYGFDQLTPLAAAVELAESGGEPEENIWRALQQLITVCQQFRAGEPC